MTVYLKKILIYNKKLKLLVPDLYIKIFDVKYEIKIKNKIQIHENRIIFFGLQKNLEIMDSKKTNEFFVDANFKIILSHFRPYKLFVICGININDKFLKYFQWF